MVMWLESEFDWISLNQDSKEMVALFEVSYVHKGFLDFSEYMQ